MANKRLSEKDIEQLLMQYRSERRRLSFQLDNVRQAIKGLKGIRIKTTPASTSPDGVPVKRGPGRPRKTDAERAASAAAPKNGRRKRRQIKDGGYRLSDWDTMVIDTINKTGKLLPKEDILKYAITWANKHHPDMSREEVEAKITRVLQKLSGKRGELGTHRSGLRRGYHYGVKDWFFASSGKLRKQHLERLELDDK